MLTSLRLIVQSDSAIPILSLSLASKAHSNIQWVGGIKWYLRSYIIFRGSHI